MAEPIAAEQKNLPKFTEYNDLISERNGGKILFATDDWFAVAENLLKAEEPEWHEGEFTEFGKWMDGWETRRKRIPGHDWAIIKLGVPGVLFGVTVDTAYFTGNYAPRFSLQAAYLTPNEESLIPVRNSAMGTCANEMMLKQMSFLQSEKWKEILPMMQLQGGYKGTRFNHYVIRSKTPWTHIRLNIFPDGGIARLRIYGEAYHKWDLISPTTLIDLIAMVNGGVCVGYSNAHYGHPRNIIRPGKGINMGDGWETARRLDRPPILQANEKGIIKFEKEEWAMFRLGRCGFIKEIEVDTTHFRGNCPDSIIIEGTTLHHDDFNNKTAWKPILPNQKLVPHTVHTYGKKEMEPKGPFTHVRVRISPDGGISRLRIWGCLFNKL